MKVGIRRFGRRNDSEDDQWHRHEEQDLEFSTGVEENADTPGPSGGSKACKQPEDQAQGS